LKRFSAKLAIIGVNPHLVPPKAVVEALFKKAGREPKGPLQIKGLLRGKAYRQTLVKYAGAWRLYLNGPMLKDTGLALGDLTSISVDFDPKPRIEPMPRPLAAALKKSAKARSAFAKLSPSRRKEILRYLNFSKTEATLLRNVGHVMTQLRGGKPKGLHAVLRQPKKRGSN
jgi:hypothetical protein